MCDDFVSDVIAKLQQRIPELCDKKAALVEREIRQHWGGDRAYIGKTSADRADRLQRDMSIYRDYSRGERPAFLARRYALSVRRIRQIISAQKKIEKARQLGGK